MVTVSCYYYTVNGHSQGKETFLFPKWKGTVISPQASIRTLQMHAACDLGAQVISFRRVPRYSLVHNLVQMQRRND